MNTFKRAFSIGFATTAALMVLAVPATMAWDDNSRDSRSGSQDRNDRNNDRDRNESRYDRSNDRGIIPPYIKERSDAWGQPR